MALPVSGSGLPHDIAISGWAAITVQVAWTLRRLNANPRGVLRIARDHVLFQLEPNLRLTAAEDLADHLTRGFVARYRGRALDPTFKQDFAMPVSERWRRLIEESADPVGRIVFRQHYGAGVKLERLAQHYGLDVLAVEGGIAGLRATVRRIALEDGLPIKRWSDARLDRQLERLANFSPFDSPPLFEVAEGCHRDWVERCPRCERTFRLIRSGDLVPEDLEVPVGTVRPSGRVHLLAVQLAPEAAGHLPLLAKELSSQTRVIGSDVLVVDESDDSEVGDRLRLAAELGTPHRDLVRTARLEGPGRWTRFGLIGPLAERSVERLRRQPWGTLDEEGDLPEPLPEPPSSRWLWAGVAGLACALVAAVALTLAAPGSSAEVELRATFTPARDGVWYHFTTSDDAQILIIQEVDGELVVRFQSKDPADKAALARADGTYLSHAIGGAVLVVASAEPLEEVEALVAAAAQAPEPLVELAARLRHQRPAVAVARSG